VKVSDIAKEAVSIFSTKNDRGEIPIVLIPTHRSWSNMFLRIPTGCYCMLQKWGKDEGLAVPGMSFKPPWWRVAYVVTQQSCNYHAPVRDCPTQDNVRVNVDMLIVFAIRDPKQFVYKLGATHFDQLLSGAVDEGIRILVRSQTHDLIWKLRGNRAESLLQHLNHKFTESGVMFSNCTITSVTLPSSLQQSLESTTTMVKAMDKATRDQEYELQEIRRSSDLELDELKRKHEQVVVAESGNKKRVELQHEQKKVKMQENRQVQVIDAQQKAQVKLMEAKAALERTKTDMEKHRVESISKAEAKDHAARTQADVDYETALVNAEAERQKFLGEAKSIKLDAAAEAEAGKHLTNKRKHDLDIREKAILTKLAEKAKYNLIGEPGDRLVDAVMTGHVAGSGTAGGGGGIGAGWFGK